MDHEMLTQELAAGRAELRAQRIHFDEVAEYYKAVQETREVPALDELRPRSRSGLASRFRAWLLSLGVVAPE